MASPPSQSGHQSPHSGLPSGPGQSQGVTAAAAAADFGVEAVAAAGPPSSPPPPSHDLPTIPEDDINGNNQEKNKNKRENEKHGKTNPSVYSGTVF